MSKITIDYELFNSFVNLVVEYAVERCDSDPRFNGTWAIDIERVTMEQLFTDVTRTADITPILDSEMLADIKSMIRKELKLGTRKAWYEYGYCQECEG